MSFAYTDRHREEYLTDGLTILRGLIPPGLLADLRREAEKAREIAHRRGGPQTQRLQPVYAYEEIDPRPFREFLDLPGLRDAVAGIPGGSHRSSDIMGILFEPAQAAWGTNWHRDWGHHVRGLDMARFFAAARDMRMFNQLNGALYDDSSLWVVPGSHAREDTPEERAAFPRIPPPGPALDEGMSEAEREQVCQAYARRMPGAIPVALRAGDVAFYRACGWHIGVYSPGTRRATLHDGFYSDEDRAWQASMREIQASAAAAG